MKRRTVRYIVKTRPGDLHNSYGGVTPGGWQFVSVDDQVETWACETTMPQALERLLNTDDAVISYDVSDD